MSSNNSRSKESREYLVQTSPFKEVETEGQKNQRFVEGHKALSKEISNRFQKYNDDNGPEVSERVIGPRTEQLRSLPESKVSHSMKEHLRSHIPVCLEHLEFTGSINTASRRASVKEALKE